MINIIVPPVIIILVIALLITIFARALSTIDDDEFTAKDIKEKNSSKRRTRPSLWQRLSQRLKRTAYRRQQKAQQHEKGQEHEGLRHEVSKREDASDSDAQHKLSRMGELILSYHKGGVDGEKETVEHDTREAMLVKDIEANPKNPDTYQRLGDYYMEMQKYEDARESYKYVLRINPRHRRAQEAMKSLDRILG